MGVSEEKLFVKDGRAMLAAPFWPKNFCLEMFEGRNIRQFENSFMVPITEDPVEFRVHALFQDIRIT